jgi:GNAT superfamily N-acetyltransferase
LRYTTTEQTIMQDYLTTLTISAICEHTGANAGYIRAAISPDQASIKPVEVAQPYRRLGIARQLLKLMLTRLSGVRFRDKQVYIHVRPYQDDPESREQLRALCTQYGFILSRVRPPALDLTLTHILIGGV